jgi:hypothetical protein
MFLAPPNDITVAFGMLFVCLSVCMCASPALNSWPDSTHIQYLRIHLC